MHEILEVILLILIANATPVLVSYFFDHEKSLSIDFGYKLNDQQYLFGESKTWRGLISSITMTGLISLYLNSNIWPGITIALLAMSGDLISSFIKRRLHKPASTKVTFLDQVPESLLPAFGAIYYYPLGLIHIIVISLSFTIIDILVSKILYQFGIRKKPY